MDVKSTGVNGPCFVFEQAQPERETDRIKDELKKKEVELMELKRRQLEMELEQMKKAIQETMEKVIVTFFCFVSFLGTSFFSILSQWSEYRTVLVYVIQMVEASEYQTSIQMSRDNVT